MKCKEVNKLLSVYMDEVLERREADNVSRHLEACANCRRELGGLIELRRSLMSLGQVKAPEYLRHLVEFHLASAEHETLRVRVREALEYWWDKVRTTETLWYVTRFAGSVVTVLFFIFMSASIKPIYFDLNSRAQDGAFLSQAGRYQLAQNVLKNLGLRSVEAQKKPISPRDPKINELYFLNFGEQASRTGQDDDFSVVTAVDRSGVAKIQNVLEYPANRVLLEDFNYMIQNARCRPASQNGKAVDSLLVLSFSQISVHE